MAVELKIRLVRNGVIAFHVGYDLWFLRTRPVPQLFNSALVQQIVYNFDNWFQANTHQRHSYQGFLDMAGAFEDGLRLSYSMDDLAALMASAAVEGKNYAIAERIGDYRKHYWIEVLDPVKLESIHADAMRQNFEKFRQKMGDDRLHNNLCRLWKLARQHRPSAALVFEKLIQRLGRLPEEPRYPATTDLDADLVRAVLGRLMGKSLGVYKGVDPDVQQKVEALSHVPRPDQL